MNGRNPQFKEMKRLFILRHAKSSWDDPAQTDFDRPLNARGREAAPFMGEFMAGRQLLPAIIIGSPAVRAMQTAGLVREAAGFDVPLKYDERIYEATPQMLLTVLSEVSDETTSVLLVGHNPGMEGLVYFLSRELHPMPTAALASISLRTGSWVGLAEGSGTLDGLFKPKQLMKEARGEGG